MSAVAEAITKLQSLSDERAGKVVSLIDDLAQLEALENQADLEAARASLAEPGADIAWEKVKEKLDAKFGHPSAAS